MRTGPERSHRRRGAAARCILVLGVRARAALFQQRLPPIMDKEPIYKQAYKCSNKRCTGWLYKGAADARGETHCIKCLSPFQSELIYKAVSQKASPRERPTASAGRPNRQ